MFANIREAMCSKWGEGKTEIIKNDIERKTGVKEEREGIAKIAELDMYKMCSYQKDRNLRQ